MSRNILLAAGGLIIIVIAAGAGYYFGNQEQSPVATLTPVGISKTATDYREQLNQLQTTLAQLQNQIATQADVGTQLGAMRDSIRKIDQRLQDLEANTQADMENPSVSPVEDYEDPEEVELRRQQTYSLYEQELLSQQPDTKLATNVSERITSFIQEYEEWSSMARLVTTECTIDFCKLEVDFSQDMDATARFELENGLALIIADSLPGGTINFLNQPDGNQRMIAYMARTGKPLPQLPPENQ